jgi:hypothetical protein
MGGLGSFFGLKGLGYSSMMAGLADASVAGSMPIVGPFQMAASMSGLEALGGVSLSPIITAAAKKLTGMLTFLKPADPGIMGLLSRFAPVALSAVGSWELGRLVGSGNLAQYGAMYAFGRFIEDELVKPYVLPKIPGLSGFGLGQARIPDQDELRDLGYLSQARIPDQDELRDVSDVGQRIVTEEELLGDVGDEEPSEDSAMF